MEAVRRYASEGDLVANYLLPQLKDAAKMLGVMNIIEFHVEKSVDGIADLTAEKGGRGLFLVEAKFKKQVAGVKHDIEPRDPDVINQAVVYAAKGGYPFYATCNSKRLVLFQLIPGKKPWESEVASFEYERSPEWASEMFKTALGVVPPRLKLLDDALVDMLHEAFRDLYPRVLYSFAQRLSDKKFNDRYVEWLQSQGLEFTEENNRLIAEQATYLQLTKLLFYGVVQSIYPEKLRPLRIDEKEDVHEALQKFFNEVRKIDYEPIYETDIVSEIPLTPGAEERIRTLVDTLNEFDYASMGSDFLGRVYEKLIPPLERKRLGQFYTPPGIVDFIIQLTLRKADAVVLDPGCGSGSFLVKAYHRLRELNHIPREMKGPLGEGFHQQLLDHVYGVDINQFPAHLSVINLAIQNPGARIKNVNVVVKDFFEISPGQVTLAGFGSLTTEGKPTTVGLESITAEGKPTLVRLPPVFDVVVANPPYIRQELLGEKEKLKIKKLIEGEFREKLFIGGVPPKKLNDAIVLDKQSDVYIYFFIHGISLLRNNGSLGFISSNKWLEVGYGEPFQEFLLNCSKIHFIVEFDRAVFQDAEVNTAVTILEKEPSKQKRDPNLVRFIRVKKRLDMDSLLQLISKAKESYEDDSIRINLVRQSQLIQGKWNIYFRAPPIYLDVLQNERLRPLGDLADVFFGIKTGYNEYFILSRRDAEDWGIEKEYLRPVITSPKKIRGLVVKPKDVDEYLFICHKGKAGLQGTKALSYIEYGEKLKVRLREVSFRPKEVSLLEVPSIKNREPWYDLPEYDVPPIIIQELYDRETRALWNQAEAHGRAPLYYCIPHKKENAKTIVAFLNSSIAMMMFELYGRSYGGGVLDIKVYETKQIPVLDPLKLSAYERTKIDRAFDELVEAVELRCRAEDELEKVKSKGRRIGLFEPEAKKRLDEAIGNERKAREQLDEAVYDALSLTVNERRQIRRGLEELQEIRRLRTQA